MPTAERTATNRLRSQVHSAKLVADIKIAPAPDDVRGFGVMVKVNNKALQARLCQDKPAIIKFLDEVL